MGKTREEWVRAPWRGTQAQSATASPGKASSSEHLPPAPGPGGSLWGPHAGMQSSTVTHKVGNDWVDEGPGCESLPAASPGCFLTDAQRVRIVASYQARVNAAQACYLAALQMLRVDEILRAEPEKSHWVFDLLLDVIGTIAGRTATNIAKLIAGGELGHVAAAVGGEIADAATHAQDATAEVSHAVGFALGMGKAKALKAITPGASREKTAAVNYLEALADASSAMYEELRERMIAGVSDSALVVLFDSFRASAGHTVSAYKEEVAGKLARFKTSGLSRIGVDNNPDARLTSAIVGADTMDSFGELETKAFWVKTPIGYRLALYRRGHRPVATRTPDIVGYRDRTPAEMRAATAEDMAERPFMLQGYVAAEFVAVAIDMHTKTWGEEPTEHAAGIDEIAQMGSNR